MKSLMFLIGYGDSVVMPLTMVIASALILMAVLRPPSQWKCGVGADAKVLARYDVMVKFVAVGLAWLLGILTTSLAHS